MIGNSKLVGRRLFLAGGTLTLAAACTCVSQKEYDALKAELEAARSQTLVQTGQLLPAAAGTKPTGWATTESIRGGLQLLAAYDSSGPDAWSAKDHPVVYITSEGASKLFSPGSNTVPGVMIIDAYTKAVVASARFEGSDEAKTQHGHGVGISPDGKWLHAGNMIINARTLRLDKVLSKPIHHSIGFKDWQGRDRVTRTTNSGPNFILDPNDDNRVVMAITGDNVPMMGHNYVTVDPTGKFLYQNMRPSSWGGAGQFGATAGVAKVNLETRELTYIWGLGENGNPIGTSHTADGKYTYVNDGHNSHVYKIDNTTNQVVGETSAGVAGPYGNRLNWDETELWIVGKGEGSHNRGGVLAVIDTKTFRQFNTFNQPIALGGSAASIDHAILHPDPAVNELWVSNMGGWETIVLDLNTKKVKGYIATPHGGDTHSGGFVRYKADWTGELLTDMGGPQRPMYATMRDKAAAVVASR